MNLVLMVSEAVLLPAPVSLRWLEAIIALTGLNVFVVEVKHHFKWWSQYWEKPEPHTPSWGGWTSLAQGSGGENDVCDLLLWTNSSTLSITKCQGDGALSVGSSFHWGVPEKHSESLTDCPPRNALSLRSICCLPFVLPYPFACSLSFIYFSSGLRYHFLPPSTHEKLLRPQTETLTSFILRSDARVFVPFFNAYLLVALQSKSHLYLFIFLFFYWRFHRLGLVNLPPAACGEAAHWANRGSPCLICPCFYLLTICSAFLSQMLFWKLI